MDTRKRGSTSEMQVTSIRLEPELKERLREISGEQGYQTLIRDVLWRFVEQQVRPDNLLHDGKSMQYCCTLNATVFIEFLKRLIAKYQHKLFRIVDRHPVHRKHLVRQWLEEHRSEIEC